MNIECALNVNRNNANRVLLNFNVEKEIRFTAKLFF